MKPIFSQFEVDLAKRLNLPDTRCIYTPKVYWSLPKETKDTLHAIQRKRR